MGPPPDVPPVRAFTRVREGPSRRRSSAAMADEAGTRAATAARARIIFFTVISSVVWCQLGDRDHPFAVRALSRSMLRVSGAAGTSVQGPAGYVSLWSALVRRWRNLSLGLESCPDLLVRTYRQRGSPAMGGLCPFGA